MPKLRTFVEVEEYYSGKLTEIFLPDVDYMDVVDSTVLDYTDDEVPTEYCEVGMKDGTTYIFRSSLSFAIYLFRDIMRFKMAELMGLKTSKIFVY